MPVVSRPSRITILPATWRASGIRNQRSAENTDGCPEDHEKDAEAGHEEERLRQHSPHGWRRPCRSHPLLLRFPSLGQGDPQAGQARTAR